MDRLKSSSAIFSICRRYRYKLYRGWNLSLPSVAFIGLNPSTADEHTDDPTIRRCITYAKDWGYGSLYMVNLFAFRATDPKIMRTEPEPVGPDNNLHLENVMELVSLIICAWGVWGNHLDRDVDVTHLLSRFDLYCLAKTKAGYPKHPLYLKKDLKPILF